MNKLFAIFLTVCVCTLALNHFAAADDTSVNTQLQSLQQQIKSSSSLDIAQLETLADETERLADQLNNPAEKLQAMDIRQKALFELAWKAKNSGKVRDLAYHVGQLRSAALAISQLDTHQAGIAGGYWLLQADLFDINAASVGQFAMAKLRIERMEAFIGRWSEKNGKENGIVSQVKVGLLREYDESG